MKPYLLSDKDGRDLALEVLIRVEQNEAYANRVLHTLFSRYNPSHQIRAQATDLVYGTLRHLTKLDAILSQFIKKPLDKLEPWVHQLLRCSLYDLGPGKAPSYAVVNEAVKIAKKRGHEGIVKFVNGVLRSYLRSEDKIDLPSYAQSPREHFIIAHSHPAWLIDTWMNKWKLDRIHHLVRINNQPAPLSLRVNTLKSDLSSVIKALDDLEINAVPSEIVPEAIHLLRSPGLEGFTPIHEGKVIIQDIGAMLITYLLAPKPNEQIVDLCAAPGGKTTHIAQMMNNSGLIWAIDQYEAKTSTIRASAHRMGINIIHEITADARIWHPEELVDAVLLDAPCSGTGVIRRRPDLKWRRTENDVNELVILQRELLSSAATLLRPGGHLVYSTCSIQPVENEDQVKWFLKKHPEFLRDQDPDSFKRMISHPSLDTEITNEGILVFPSEQTDGFFMTRLIKQS